MKEGNTKQLISGDNLLMSIFLYGATGSGKTRFLGTMPDPYLILTERPPKGLAIAGVDVPFVEVESFSDIITVLNQIVSGTRAKDRKSIGFDSLSNLTYILVKDVLKETGKSIMDLHSWGIVSGRVKDIIILLTKEVIRTHHICMTAKEQLIKDELSGSVIGLPETVGKNAHTVPGEFDYVFYAYQTINRVAGKKVPSWQMDTIIYQGRYAAKDCSGKLDQTVPNNFHDIYSTICGGLPA